MLVLLNSKAKVIGDRRTVGIFNGCEVVIIDIKGSLLGCKVIKGNKNINVEKDGDRIFYFHLEELELYRGIKE